MEKTEQHSITPSPELVRKWYGQISSYDVPVDYIATQAAQWGADQELEACVQVMNYRGQPDSAKALFRARRPKPPSLKEQALDQLRALDQYGALDCNTDKIRRALEALPND
jgi:hypothetical protein